MTEVQTEGYELRHYVGVLRRRWPLVVLPMVAFAMLGFLLGSGSKPSYSSSASVLTVPVTTSAGAAGPAANREPTVGNEIAIMSSDEIRSAVDAAAGHHVRANIVQANPDNSVVTITVTGPLDRVQGDAQTYAETYVANRREQLAAASKAAIAQLTKQLDDIDADLAALAPQLREINTRIAGATDEIAFRALDSQREALLAERDALENRRAPLQAQLDQQQLNAVANPTYGIEILTDSSAPAKAASAEKRRFASAGLALGLVLGVLLAFLAEHFDQSIRFARDLELAGRGHRVLAQVGRAPRLLRRSLADRGSTRAEAYRRLRTVIDLAGGHRGVRLVVGPSPSSGSTTTVANLGVALAAAGSKVLLIDADLRHPTLHAIFGLRNERGLSSVLVEGLALSDAVQPVPGQPGVELLAAGPAVDDPAAVLSGPAADRLVQSTRERADTVLVDGPPILAVADGVVLSKLADDVLLVARAGHTTRQEVGDALDLLAPAGTPVLGTVLTDVDRAQAKVVRYGHRSRAAASPQARHRIDAPVHPQEPRAADEVQAPALGQPGG